MSNVPEALPVPRGSDSDHPDFFATQQLRALNPNEQPAELLILSRESALIDVVSNATPGIVRISKADDLEHAVKTLPEVTPGILVVDVSGVSDLASMLQQLSQRYPDVVTLVAGKREHLAALLRLADAGRIFRYLQIPLAHGQTRLAVGAAVAQHLVNKTSKQPSTSLPSPAATIRKPPFAYLALGAGLLVVIIGGWLALRTSPDSPAPPPAASTTPAPPKDAVQLQLALATDAIAQGRYVEPAGANALEAYRRVLQLEPANAAALAGLRTVADRVLELAEQSLRADRLEEALQSITAARAIDANNPRLPLLDMQVTREQERLSLGRARDTTTRVRKLIAQASTDISRQRLVRPPGSNAYEALVQAQRLDPTDPAVTLATRELNTAIIEAARNAVSAGDTAQAVLLIDAARKLGATGTTFADTERLVADANRSVEPAVAHAPAAKTAVPEGTRPAASKTAPATAAAIPPAAAGATVASINAANSATATVQPREIPPAEVSAQPQDVGDRQPSGSAADPAVNAVLQAAALTRTRETSPDYPTQAAIDGTEGWVDIDFTISTEGVPQDLKVRDASPKRLFDRAAVASLRQWRFEPIKQDGVAVARRATLRVRFQPH